MFYLRKMWCPRQDSIPEPLTLQATALPTELKEISTNAVSRGGYEHTTVPITLGRGAFPLQYYTIETCCVIVKRVYYFRSYELS
jgi:hypothetical protein